MIDKCELYNLWCDYADENGKCTCTDVEGNPECRKCNKPED